MNETDQKLFRECERQLDEHYRLLPLWRRRRSEAIYGIMTIPDMVYLVLMTNSSPLTLTVASAQTLKGMEDGVAQALRWLTSDGCTMVRSVADCDLIEEAGHFSMYASDYVDIADLHMMYGRGWASASLNAELKVITFDPIEGPGQSDLCAFHEAVRGLAKRCVDLRVKVDPLGIERARQALNHVEYKLVDGRIRLGELRRDLVDQTRELLKPHRELELLPLPPDTDMLAFTVSEFWRFMEAVTLWSHAAFMRYMDCATHGVPQYACMPTQIVMEDEFVQRVTALSCLSPELVRAILDRLSFRPDAKANILLTPFLRGDGYICWSPAGIMKYRHERNLLKVMSRGPRAQHARAATVNGKRDQLLGRRIGEEFATRGYQFKLNTPVAANGESTDVDVLLYRSERPHEILIVEAKALIAPDEINEVHRAAEEMGHAQEQARTAMRVLSAMPLVEKRQKFRFVKWDRITEHGYPFDSTSPHW